MSVEVSLLVLPLFVLVLGCSVESEAISAALNGALMFVLKRFYPKKNFDQKKRNRFVCLDVINKR